MSEYLKRWEKVALLVIIACKVEAETLMKQNIRNMDTAKEHLQIMSEEAEKAFHEICKGVTESQYEEVQAKAKTIRLTVLDNEDPRVKTDYALIRKDDFYTIAENVIEHECYFCEKSTRDSMLCPYRISMQRLGVPEFDDYRNCPFKR